MDRFRQICLLHIRSKKGQIMPLSLISIISDIYCMAVVYFDPNKMGLRRTLQGMGESYREGIILRQIMN